ncbi:MAG TPA: aldehyde dehydrogenase family protein, partial [Amycolatopsis sp.]|nr:aldehyde dehydrogenase family protein [Amycolatopsis sp.]
MRDYEQVFLGGDWVAPAGAGTIEVRSPATGDLVGRVPQATPADIDAAVTAARRAFDDGPWPRWDPAERADLLGKLGKALKTRSAELTELISDEIGSPRTWARGGQIATALGALRAAVTVAASYPWTETRPG